MAEPLADMLTVMHGALPGPIDYDMWYGLNMNEQRMMERDVYKMGLAMTYAQSRGEVPLSIFSSVSFSKDQAEDMHFEVNANRTLGE